MTTFLHSVWDLENELTMRSHKSVKNQYFFMGFLSRMNLLMGSSKKRGVIPTAYFKDSFLVES